jgi:ribosomal-protein-alanine N-acetyltransferase
MSIPAPILTAHLELRPHDPAHLRALYHGPEAYERCSGHKAAAGLFEFFTSDAVRPEWLARLATATQPDPWAFGFGLFLPPGMTLVGCAGFVTPPGPEGIVELAYGVAPEHQGKGYATETAQALVSFAFADPNVRTVRAHTLPENNASTRVLTKCGFTRVADQLDPVDGLVWRWEKQK